MVVAGALAACGGTAPVPPVTTFEAAAEAPTATPYAGLVAGYDVSWPQCGQPDRAPEFARFSILGVNAGRAFTANPCLAKQWKQARPHGPRSLYVNSGYLAANLARSSVACRGRAAQQLPGASMTAERDAYAIGCTEAELSLSVASRAGARSPSMWWLDVETANSWSEDRLDLNRLALLGEIERLLATAQPIGVYSSFDDWKAITGGWTAPWVRANWVAGRPALRACADVGFSGAPVWLVQDVPASANLIDVDRVC